MEACRASGLTIAAWCREHGVKEHQMWYWRKRFKVNEPSSPQWIPVSVHDDREDGVGLTIHLDNLSVEVQPGFDRQLLTDVLEVLSSRC